MSELNIYHHELRPDEYDEFYLKYEADKVIAEKDAEIARLNDKALQYKVLDKEHCRDLNTQERRFALQIAHHKYKRCLAMARWCRTSARCDEGLGAFKYRDWYWKWFKRWLELAEKFWNQNDYRTLKNVMPKIKMAENNAFKHNALEDCKAQMRGLQAFYKLLNEPSTNG